MFQLTIRVNATDHTIGPARASVTIVEYGDFECPNCKQAAPAVKLLLSHFTGRIRFAFRHFPQEEVHPHALLAAQAAECAGGQGHFWPMHDLLFEHQPRFTLSQLRGHAGRLNMDLPRFDFEIKDTVYLQRIREHMQSGLDSGARGTPAFFVNGRIHDVSFGTQSLFDAVEAALRALART
jgi:protein-disulfide isomerase